MVLKLELNGKGKTTAINALVVAVFRYGVGILQWKDSELKGMDMKLRKTMTMFELYTGRVM